MEIHAFVVEIIRLWQCEPPSPKLFCNYLGCCWCFILSQKWKRARWRRAPARMLSLALRTWDSRRKDETGSSADFFWLASEGYVPFSPICTFGCLWLRKPRFHWRDLLCRFRVLTFSFHFWGGKLSPSQSTFLTGPFSSVAPWLIFFSPLYCPGILRFWILRGIPTDHIQLWMSGAASCSYELCFPVQLNKPCSFLTCHFWHLKNKRSLVTWWPSILDNQLVAEPTLTLQEQQSCTHPPNGQECPDWNKKEAHSDGP